MAPDFGLGEQVKSNQSKIVLFFLSCLSFTWSWRALKGLQWCAPEEGAWLHPLLDRWGNRGSGHPNCERPDDASRPRLPAPHWLPPSLPSLPQRLAAPGPGGSLQPCRGRESSLRLLGACSRAQGSGICSKGQPHNGGHTSLKGRLHRLRASPATGRERGAAQLAPAPAAQGPSRPLSFQPPSSQLLGAHLAQGNGRGLRLSALLQKDKQKIR